VPVDPATLSGQLERAGFVDVRVERWTAATRDGAKVRFLAPKESSPLGQ
jgi:hypothetical protein